MDVSAQLDHPVLKEVRKHLGLLAIEFVRLDSNGKHIGAAEMQSYSGFFVALDDEVFFVTAGHVLQRDGTDGRLGLVQARDAKAIRINRAFIGDYFSPHAETYSSGSGELIPLPTIVELSHLLEKAVYFNDKATGLDFAFMPLREFYVRGITANGTVPITEAWWQENVRATKFVLAGFPDEEKTPSATDTSAEATVCLCFAVMERCELPDHLSRPSLPYFAAKLPDSDPISPVGFSGSPIFGVVEEPGKASYTLVAIDHKWHPAERIIVGCFMTDVVSEFRRRRAAQTP
jgi:hypothetical protein